MTKKIMILLMVFVMLLCHPFCVQAEGEEDETQTIQARFYTLLTPGILLLSFILFVTIHMNNITRRETLSCWTALK